MKILFTDASGIYIPQLFARWYSHPENQPNPFALSSEDIQILTDGPDHPDYWESWNSVLSNNSTLYQDGDLWIMEPSDIVLDSGDIVNAIENPYLCPETLEYCIDKVEGFEDDILRGELVSLIDGLLDTRNIHDLLTHNKASNGDPQEQESIKWALENFYNLDFCLEHNRGWHCDNEKLGYKVKFSPSYLQTESGQDETFDGIFLTTIGNLGEVEIQCENGKCHYLSGFSSDYFRLIARLNTITEED